MNAQDLVLFVFVCIGPAACAVGLPLIAVALTRGLDL